MVNETLTLLASVVLRRFDSFSPSQSHVFDDVGHVPVHVVHHLVMRLLHLSESGLAFMVWRSSA